MFSVAPVSASDAAAPGVAAIMGAAAVPESVAGSTQVAAPSVIPVSPTTKGAAALVVGVLAGISGHSAGSRHDGARAAEASARHARGRPMPSTTGGRAVVAFGKGDGHGAVSATNGAQIRLQEGLSLREAVISRSSSEVRIVFAGGHDSITVHAEPGQELDVIVSSGGVIDIVVRQSAGDAVA